MTPAEMARLEALLNKRNMDFITKAAYDEISAEIADALPELLKLARGAAHFRKEALEEAAKIAEDAWLGTELTKTYFNSLAAAIRALLNASPGVPARAHINAGDRMQAQGTGSASPTAGATATPRTINRRRAGSSNDGKGRT